MNQEAFKNLKKQAVEDFILTHIPQSVREGSVLNARRWANKFLLNQYGSGLHNYLLRDGENVCFSYSKSSWASDQTNMTKTTKWPFSIPLQKA